MILSTQRPHGIPLATPAAPPQIVPADLDQTIQITGGADITPATLEQLKATSQRAVQFFQANFGAATRPLKLDVSASQPALKTGYDADSDTIHFPRMKTVINSGLDSVDVINHEIFHALAVQSIPEAAAHVGEEEAVRLHEGLADYFAYQLNPDAQFGENYFVGKPYIRLYHTDMAVSLAPGSHAQGNAITSLLLKDAVTPAQIKEFMADRPFTLAGLASVSPELKRDLDIDLSFSLTDNPINYPVSASRRYQIEGQPLQLEFTANPPLREAHPNLRIDWSTIGGIPSKFYLINQTEPGSFEIGKKPGAKVEKVLALFKDGDALIGSRPFYFGPGRKSADLA